MGMWEADCRHGAGLLVTLDGIYNQGTFVQNKLSVCTEINTNSMYVLNTKNSNSVDVVNTK